MKYYVAYGSNLNKEQMKYRCPGARPVYTGFLDNWELIYRRSLTGAYATIRRRKKSRVPVVVWEIGASDEYSLDRYEGYPHLYYKQNVYVSIPDHPRIRAMVYIMNEQAVPGKPSKRYIDSIYTGYLDFGLDLSYLQNSLLKNATEMSKERI